VGVPLLVGPGLGRDMVARVMVPQAGIHLTAQLVRGPATSAERDQIWHVRPEGLTAQAHAPWLTATGIPSALAARCEHR
jgi:hypothetical protein